VAAGHTPTFSLPAGRMATSPVIFASVAAPTPGVQSHNIKCDTVAVNSPPPPRAEKLDFPAHRIPLESCAIATILFRCCVPQAQPVGRPRELIDSGGGRWRA